MATKWKNTDDKSKWEAIKERNQDVVTLVGGALLLTGLFFVATLIVFRDELGDESGTVVGVLGNLSLAAGSVMIVDMIMKNRYGDWMPEGEERYREWKETVRKMNRRDWKIGGAAFILAWIYLGIMILGYGYYYSAVSGYMLVITVLVQFLVYEWRIRRFWQKKLDAVTEKTEEEKEELIRQRIEEAREIERESLEKVSRSDQLRIDLITNVSHDLKTPLTSMVGYIELMKKEELSDVMRDYVDVLSERAEKLKEMISSLFSLAKASSGNVELKMESFEMNRLIDQIFADMDDRIREIDWGSWEGLGCTERNYEIPDENYNLFLTDALHFAGSPDGESVADVCDRTAEFLQEVIHNPEYEDKTILISTHGCAMRAMLNPLYENRLDFWQGHVPYNCTVNVVEAHHGLAKLAEKDKIYYDASLCFDNYKVVHPSEK